jgi:hypothetical protein
MVKYSDLSGWLKTSVVVSWVIGGLYALAFVVGFIGALSY